MKATSRRNQLHPLARSTLSLATGGTQERLARGLGSGLKPLLMKKGLGLMESLQALPAEKEFWGVLSTLTGTCPLSGLSERAKII